MQAVVISGFDPKVLRQALNLGFHLEKRKEGTFLCIEERATGSAFGKRSCYDQEHMKILLEQVFQTQDTVRSQCAGMGCGGPLSR